MRTRELITDDEYLDQKSLLIGESEEIKNHLNKHTSSKVSGSDIVNELNFISKAKDKFKNGDEIERKELIRIFGQKLILADKKLAFTPVDWLVPIRENYSEPERQFFALEPLENEAISCDKNKKTPVGSSVVLSKNRQTLGLNDLNSTWLRQLGSNQRPNR